MDGYLSWNEKIITDFSDKNINAMYDNGFVFTRLGYGQMTQTRSIRIDLNKFELNSENRRVLRKIENIELEITPLPHPDYDWHIHQLGFNFYTKKFGQGTFSANKIKELLNAQNSNFNLLVIFKLNNKNIGYCICRNTDELLHYSYPFYDLETSISNLGLGMMTKAVIWAKEQGKKYIYLGSAKDKTAMYKLQFSGLEWFDNKEWKNNIEELKNILLAA